MIAGCLFVITLTVVVVALFVVAEDRREARRWASYLQPTTHEEATCPSDIGTPERRALSRAATNPRTVEGFARPATSGATTTNERDTGSPTCWSTASDSTDYSHEWPPESDDDDRSSGRSDGQEWVES